MTRTRPWLCLLLGFASGLAAALPVGALSLAVSGDAIVATHATAGGQVALIGAGREIRETVPLVVRDCDLVTAGPDGLATFDLGRNVPANHYWLAFDLSSGLTALASSQTSFASVAGFPHSSLIKDLPGAVTEMRVEVAGFYQALVVRPGAGAWCNQGIDGGSADADLQEDGALTFAVSGMTGLGGTTAPLAALQAGDVLAIVDSETLEASFVVLTAAQIDAGTISQ